ncbi:hypothetical protein ACHAXA_010114 [Cyclostephanos tholiformis]|uniref:Uncharacterized protein n=1 Tax=Cyclostephanos tholiformis TaxID=382380 RepID=A0ABD3RXQ6_9STRA
MSPHDPPPPPAASSPPPRNDGEKGSPSVVSRHKTTPAAPVSGQIPSPTGGVRTRGTSDNQSPQLRHRPQHHHHRCDDNNHQAHRDARQHRLRHRSGEDDPPPQNQLHSHSSLLGSYSLDYADADADAVENSSAIELTPLRGSTMELQWQQTRQSRQRQERQQQPQKQKQQQQPPFAQKMERGINRLLMGGRGSGDGKGRVAYYGGSEHDFNDDDCSSSCNSSSTSASSVVAVTAVMRDRDRNIPRPTLSSSMGTPHPDEITTENNRRQQQHQPRQQQQQQHHAPRARSFPPYGLAMIRDSPGVASNGSGGIEEDHNDNFYAVDQDHPIPPSSLSSSSPPLDFRTARAGSSFIAIAEVDNNHEDGDNYNNKKFKVLGWDLSNSSRRSQFLISSSGTFGFSLVYGYLQELISVSLCNRKLGLFLALAQFAGYTVLSYYFRKLDAAAVVTSLAGGRERRSSSSFSFGVASLSRRIRRRPLQSSIGSVDGTTATDTIPLEMYIGLSILRAIDLGMTNLAMQYVNYPAKTIMKSTRVVFTMMFGVIVSKKRYGLTDYSIVGIMVTGLAMFFHADANTSAVFNPLGIIMLTISLLCDGAISNLSEALMNQYQVGQDEYIFRLYSIATFFIFIAAGIKGDLRDGFAYLARPGTLKEIEEGLEPTWSIFGKVFTIALLSLSGFLGSSCSAAITKSFGALTSSITSTARKAATIFLSFALFPNNNCTLEHVGGIFFFVASLVAKSLRHSKRGKGGSHHPRKHNHDNHRRYSTQHSRDKSVNNHSTTTAASSGLGRNGIIGITDSSKDTSPLICSSPPYLRRKVGDDFV